MISKTTYKCEKCGLTWDKDWYPKFHWFQEEKCFGKIVPVVWFRADECITKEELLKELKGLWNNPKDKEIRNEEEILCYKVAIQDVIEKFFHSPEKISKKKSILSRKRQEGKAEEEVRKCEGANVPKVIELGRTSCADRKMRGNSLPISSMAAINTRKTSSSALPQKRKRMNL